MPGPIEVARKNAETLGVDGRVTFFQGDLFAAVPEGATFDVIVSNPPYVKSGDIATLQREVQKEPRAALDGGADGLELIRRLVTAALPRLKPGGLLALEIGDEQGNDVKDIMTRAGCRDVRIEKDLAPLDRIALGRA
jgi:release factor glutamine methyltransferase